MPTNKNSRLSQSDFLAKLGDNLSPIQILWIGLAERKRCLYCGKKFPDGLVNKHPGETTFSLNSEFWFTPEYLWHCHETHGFNIETMTMFLEEIASVK